METPPACASRLVVPVVDLTVEANTVSAAAFAVSVAAPVAVSVLLLVTTSCPAVLVAVIDVPPIVVLFSWSEVEADGTPPPDAVTVTAAVLVKRVEDIVTVVAAGTVGGPTFATEPPQVCEPGVAG